MICMKLYRAERRKEKRKAVRQERESTGKARVCQLAHILVRRGATKRIRDIVDAIERQTRRSIALNN